MTGKLWGLWGEPYIDCGADFDTSCFAALDRELTAGLAALDADGTGATLKWMGVVAPWVMGDGRRDAMEAIRAMTEQEFADFVALGEPTEEPLARDRDDFGDETERPFTRAQQKLLEYRHGVYFPWRVCAHLLENERWEDKHSGEGKDFLPRAQELFPQTCDFVRSLPFTELGRVVLFGLGPHDHAPLHRDTEPGTSLEVAQSLCFAPRPGKRFFLQNSPEAEPVVVSAPVYWFNDMDYHGVLPDPYFRYSLRVDGVLEPDFVRALERRVRAGQRKRG